VIQFNFEGAIISLNSCKSRCIFTLLLDLNVFDIILFDYFIYCKVDAIWKKLQREEILEMEWGNQRLDEGPSMSLLYMKMSPSGRF
jgi:hypothetical protein